MIFAAGSLIAATHSRSVELKIAVVRRRNDKHWYITLPRGPVNETSPFLAIVCGNNQYSAFSYRFNSQNNYSMAILTIRQFACRLLRHSVRVMPNSLLKSRSKWD